ncbi:MAG TPA: thioredoxin domain-containing protein [Novosphingobium sp.]|nr:thioredoxin domain-containing protein [Novosphingobium sp.]
MTSLALRRLTLIAFAAPLVLGLASCKQEAATTAANSEAIAKVAAPAGKAWADVFAVTPEGGYRIGNPDAPIKLIEFGALSCSHCAEFAEQGFPKLRGEYVESGRVSYELRFVMLNQLDIPAAALATCGAPEAVLPLSEQFWVWQPNMFDSLQKAGDAQMKAIAELPARQQSAAIAQAAGMNEFFTSRGIAAEQGAACLADTSRVSGLVARDTDWKTKYGVSGTPTFYLNGANVGSLTWAALEPMIQNAGAR